MNKGMLEKDIDRCFSLIFVLGSYLSAEHETMRGVAYACFPLLDSTIP
jgi:hypothetical protein